MTILSSSSDSLSVVVGEAPLKYRAVADWDRRPAGCTWEEVAGVAVDSRDRVFVYSRDPHRVHVFDRDGTLLHSWGEGLFVRPHGITIGPDDAVYLTDDSDHTVRKFTPEGRLLMKLGTSGRPAETGAMSVDFRTIQRAGPPFHYPTNIALAANGEIFVADGYGNARIHKFSADGKLLLSWGEPGSGPGQFHIPHGIAIDREGNVVVADRENSRLQFFDPAGKFLGQWADIARPCQVAVDSAGNLLVAELGYRAGMWPGTVPPHAGATGGRVSVFDPRGKLLARWGGGERPTEPGDFFAPHDLCLDSRGDLYVAEVVFSAGGNRGLVPADCHALQKFVRA
jgi:DNA-binding beta-propeller fold protein YncE